eukprot:3047603-Prymnesium_polylepis.1
MVPSPWGSVVLRRRVRYCSVVTSDELGDAGPHPTCRTRDVWENLSFFFQTRAGEGLAACGRSVCLWKDMQ